MSDARREAPRPEALVEATAKAQEADLLARFRRTLRKWYDSDGAEDDDLLAALVVDTRAAQRAALAVIGERLVDPRGGGPEGRGAAMTIAARRAPERRGA